MKDGGPFSIPYGLPACSFPSVSIRFPLVTSLMDQKVGLSGLPETGKGKENRNGDGLRAKRIPADSLISLMPGL